LAFTQTLGVFFFLDLGCFPFANKANPDNIAYEAKG
jgi:hypothetical protein